MATQIAAAPSLVPALRRCLGQFATGVAVVSYDTAVGPRGLTVNAFTSVSLEPPLVLVCIDQSSQAHRRGLAEAAFAVNILHAGQRALAGRFAGRADAGATPAWRSIEAVPVLEDCLAWLVCAPWSRQPAGDHVLVIGRVIAFGSGEASPLCFFRGALVEGLPHSETPSLRGQS